MNPFVSYSTEAHDQAESEQQARREARSLKAWHGRRPVTIVRCSACDRPLPSMASRCPDCEGNR